MEDTDRLSSMTEMEKQSLNDHEEQKKYDERDVKSASPIPLLIALIAILVAVVAYGVLAD